MKKRRHVFSQTLSDVLDDRVPVMGLLFDGNQIADVWALSGQHFIVKVLFPVDIGDAVLQVPDGGAQSLLLQDEHFHAEHWESGLRYSRISVSDRSDLLLCIPASLYTS